MARVKGGKVSRQRRKRVLKLAKGYFGAKHRQYKKAQEQSFKSFAFAFRDRKQVKREFRKLWITRINAAVRPHGMSYSRFMNGLKKAEVSINRKMLSELAIHQPEEFANIVEISKKSLA